MQERNALRDLTDRQAQEFNALYTVGQKVAALFDIEEILKLVVTAAVNLTQAEEGALMLLDVDTGELYLRASCSSAEEAVRNLRVLATGLRGAASDDPRALLRYLFALSELLTNVWKDAPTEARLNHALVLEGEKERTTNLRGEPLDGGAQ